MMIIDEFLDTLKKLRKESGKTQLAIAKEVGVNIYTYRMWESGGSRPNKENREKLMAVLGVKG